MSKPSNRDTRKGVAMNPEPARKVFAAGRIPSKREQELRQKVKQARRMFEEYKGHGAEINLALAERDLREFLDGRDQS